MAANAVGPTHGASGTQSAVPSPANPETEARRLLDEGRELLTRALAALQAAENRRESSHLVGQASDRIGSALHYLRQAAGR